MREKEAKAKRDGPEESHQPRETVKSWIEIPGEGGDAAEGTDSSDLRKHAGWVVCACKSTSVSQE